MIRALVILLGLAGAANAAEPPPPPIFLARSGTFSGVEHRAELDQARMAASATERSIEPRTEVDWRAGAGVTAQAGYLCGLGGIGPESEPIPGGPGSVYSRAGTFLGATLSTPLP